MHLRIYFRSSKIAVLAGQDEASMPYKLSATLAAHSADVRICYCYVADEATFICAISRFARSLHHRTILCCRPHEIRQRSPGKDPRTNLPLYRPISFERARATSIQSRIYLQQQMRQRVGSVDACGTIVDGTDTGINRLRCDGWTGHSRKHLSARQPRRRSGLLVAWTYGECVCAGHDC